mmetsp:Transcript_94797/g.245381  ORF Transcript_94797/g.245381 Transcript_94797/m.245381 type:complete len:111 (+) Transcript_94797:1123-1455(+)
MQGSSGWQLVCTFAGRPWRTKTTVQLLRQQRGTTKQVHQHWRYQQQAGQMIGGRMLQVRLQRPSRSLQLSLPPYPRIHHARGYLDKLDEQLLVFQVIVWRGAFIYIALEH